MRLEEAPSIARERCIEYGAHRRSSEHFILVFKSTRLNSSSNSRSGLYPEHHTSRLCIYCIRSLVGDHQCPDSKHPQGQHAVLRQAHTKASNFEILHQVTRIKGTEPSSIAWALRLSPLCRGQQHPDCSEASPTGLDPQTLACHRMANYADLDACLHSETTLPVPMRMRAISTSTCGKASVFPALPCAYCKLSSQYEFCTSHPERDLWRSSAQITAG